MRQSMSLILMLGLAACGAPSSGGLGPRVTMECVPFARALSGIPLRGHAADWWWAAEGRYARGETPAVGAVMVFARTPRLNNGHVAVVSRVLGPRAVQVTQANWVRGHITADQLVRDVSPHGNWSLVRVWWPRTETLGATAYPVAGFIYPSAPASHDQLARAVPGAVRMALNE